ncbi:hypothetical protein L7F22_026903 [Adiantum nelumboides]|nr:hypothetical protein [Adiantum nelumboides]
MLRKCWTKPAANNWLPGIQAQGFAAFAAAMADNDLHSFLNKHVDLFIDEILSELPPKRGDDDHKIDLIPGSSPPNKPPYRVSQAQQEEIVLQVNELVQKGMRGDPSTITRVLKHLTSIGTIGPCGGCENISQALRDALILEYFLVGVSALSQLGRACAAAAAAAEDALQGGLLGDVGGFEPVVPSVGTSRKRARVTQAEDENVSGLKGTQKEHFGEHQIEGLDLDIEAGVIDDDSVDKHGGLLEFYPKVHAIQLDLDQIQDLLRQLQEENEVSKTLSQSASVKELKGKMEADVDEVIKITRTVKEKLEKLDKEWMAQLISELDTPGSSQSPATNKGKRQISGRGVQTRGGYSKRTKISRDSAANLSSLPFSQSHDTRSLRTQTSSHISLTPITTATGQTMVSFAPQPTPQMTSPIGSVGPAPSTIVHHTGLTATTTISMEPSTSTPTPRSSAPHGITHFMSRADKLLRMERSATLSIADAINTLHGALKMHAVTYESMYEEVLDTHQRVYDRDVEKASFFDRNRILNMQVKDLKEVISSLNL